MLESESTKPESHKMLVALALLLLIIAAIAGFTLRRSLNEGSVTSGLLAPPPGPPDSEIIRRTSEGGFPTLKSRGFKFESIIRGKPLRSEGEYGPKGNWVYPIRINFSQVDYQRQIYSKQYEQWYYRDVFDEWQYKQERY